MIARVDMGKGKAILRGTLVLVASVIVAMAGGCAGDDEDAEQQSSVGVRGESCASTVDCGSGLACVGGVCSIRTFGISQTQSECVHIACRTVDECLPVGCGSLEESCAAGSTYSCAQFEATCRLESYVCESDRCVQLCTSSTQCSFGACVNGRCIECGTDDDCGFDDVCVENHCIRGCKEKSDCPAFYDCRDERCVEVGCASNRECIAHTGSTRATCQNKECVVPCETDIQCDSPSAFEFMACLNGKCTALGCESDVECRIIMNTQILGGDAECRRR
jgi:hypothetical protein